MSDQALLQKAGAQLPPDKIKYVPLLLDRSFTGLFSNRSVLHSADLVVEKIFYGGRGDALWTGLNVELSNNLTIKRRPGLIPFSDTTYPTAPLHAFSFQLTDGTQRVIIDTGSETFNLYAVDAISGVAYYHFTTSQSTAANNAFAGYEFTVAGFDQGPNNGTFECTGSTSSYLILSNPSAVTDTATSTATTSGAVYWDEQNGSKTLLFGKGEGAGQTAFVAVAGIMYAGDGVDTWCYTPGVGASQPNGNTGSFGIEDVWSWGGNAPATQPTVSVVESGSAAVQWQANTVFSTMGLLNDGTNIQLLTSIVVNGATAQFGSTGNGQPAWNDSAIQFSETSDSGVTWVSFGQIGQWQGNFSYVPRSVIYDPESGGLYVSGSTTATSGSSRPHFRNIPVDNNGNLTTVSDGKVTWAAMGSPQLWKASTLYHAWWEHSNTFICEPVLPTSTNTTSDTTQPVYAQISNPCGSPPGYTGSCSNSGTSGSGYSPQWGTTVGAITLDGDLTWTCLGSKTWASATTYIGWTPGSTSFSALVDSNSNFQVCVTSHTSGSSEPTWGTNYGQTDSTGLWICVGPADPSWASSTQWFLPTGGFSIPTSSEPFGGAEILANSDVQIAVASGKSGSVAPSWPAIGAYVTESGSTLKWFCDSAYSQFSLSFSYGHNYAYSFYSRLDNDAYNITVAAGGAGAPPGYANPLGVPTGRQDGSMSTASPVNTITGENSGAVVTVGGVGSTDPAYDTIIIWRDADGGGSSNMFFLTEIPMPTPVGGQPGTWSFADYLPDTPQTAANGVQFPGLNNLIEAPINDQNDAPPADFRPQCYDFQRIFGISEQTISWSNGPDNVNQGNPNSSFNPTNEFGYLQEPIRAVKTSQGIAVFCPGSTEFLVPASLTSAFYTVTLSPGIGLMNWNALDINSGNIFFQASDARFLTLGSSLDLSNVGWGIQDLILSDIPPAASYVAALEVSQDERIFLSDGSTGWYNLWPRATGITGPNPAWSPFAEITGGAQMVQVVEISPGIKKLLVGSPNGGNQILMRDLNTFTDGADQTTYDANFVFGALNLAPSGHDAIIRHLQFDFAPGGITPVVGYLLNEISGNFTNITKFVFDPPEVYAGPNIKPQSFSPLRYYLGSTSQVARGRFIQVSVDFGVNSYPSEMLSFTLYGRLVAEG